MSAKNDEGPTVAAAGLQGVAQDVSHHSAMSGLSQGQRRILRLALTVNMHTQGGVARVKGGTPVDGYRVPTVNYGGPCDMLSPLALWALGGAVPCASIAGYFNHTAATRCAKASLTRATTRLCQRGLLVYAPLRPFMPGYVLTAVGLLAAGTEPLQLPHLEAACELFGITSNGYPDNARYVWREEIRRKADPDDPAYKWNERRLRKRALVAELLTCGNGYPCGESGAGVTVEEQLPPSPLATLVTVDEAMA